MPDREKVITDAEEAIKILDMIDEPTPWCDFVRVSFERVLELLKGQEPDVSKYQYKIDHTDCIWYSDSESRCPVTCSQYRDGWNDAMDFIFKNGAGYSPYKRR